MKRRALIAMLLALGGAGCISRPAGLPREVFVSYKQARRLDLIEMPVAFIGTFERVSADSFRNVHGQEWGVIFRVKKTLFDSWDERTFSFNIPSPDQKWFVPGEDYYVVALHTRHGYCLHETFPVAQKPNKAPEPTPTSVTPRAGARVAPAAVVAHL